MAANSPPVLRLKKDYTSLEAELAAQKIFDNISPQFDDPQNVDHQLELQGLEFNSMKETATTVLLQIYA
jgi:hypothetical protein